MRYNGKDPDMIHKAVKRGTEYQPELLRDIHTIETSAGMVIAYAREEASEYTAEINIHGRSMTEAQEALDAVRRWAVGSGGIDQLEPTHSPGRVYDAIFQSLTPPEWKGKGTGTCQVRWMLANPYKRSVTESKARNTAGYELSLWVNGTAKTDMVIEVTPKENAEQLEITLDGEVFFVRTLPTAAGETLKIDMARESVTVDGANAAASTDWTKTNYDSPLTHGRHVIGCSNLAEVTVRWYDRWA